MIKNQITKNQHYISRFLLRKFADKKEMLFELFLKNKKIYKTNVSNSMTENYTYEDEFLAENSLESFFCEIESEASLNVDILLKSINDYEKGVTEFLSIKNIVDLKSPSFFIKEKR